MIHNPWIQASWDSKEPSSHILKPLVHCTYMVAGENTVFPLSSLHSYPTNHCSIAVVLVISASMTVEDRQIFCLCHLSIQKICAKWNCQQNIFSILILWIYVQNFPFNRWLSASFFEPINMSTFKKFTFIKNIKKWRIE